MVIAENAGIKELKMYHMVNTKKRCSHRDLLQYYLVNILKEKMTDKQKEILKKIRTLPLRKYGSAKHKKLIKEYIKYDPYFPPSKIS